MFTFLPFSLLLQHPGVAATCDLDSIRRQYYYSLFPLNPGGLIPVVPRGSDPTGLLQPHSREKLVKSSIFQKA
jgi:putative glutathione S-transferase